MKWFRFYDEVLDDPKAQRLSPVLFRHWVNLLCLASRSTNRGDLPPMSDIAFALRVNESKARTIVRDLVSAGLIDQLENAGPLQMHNWSGRQRVSDNVADRVSRHRSRNGSVTLHSTNDVTLQTPEDDVTETFPHARATETEQKQIQTPSDEGERAAQAPPPAPQEPKSGGSRGSRLPATFTVTDEMRTWARGEGLDDAMIDRETEKFRDYYRSASGQQGTKVDWPASWRNWMRRSRELGGSPSNLRTLPDRRGNPERAISTSQDPKDWTSGLPLQRGGRPS